MYILLILLEHNNYTFKTNLEMSVIPNGTINSLAPFDVVNKWYCLYKQQRICTRTKSSRKLSSDHLHTYPLHDQLYLGMWIFFF